MSIRITMIDKPPNVNIPGKIVENLAVTVVLMILNTLLELISTY